MYIRETNKIPPGWRPGMPLPPTVRAKRVYAPEGGGWGLGVHPTIVARVQKMKSRLRKQGRRGDSRISG